MSSISDDAMFTTEVDKDYYTCRHSLEDSLERAFVSPLAAVIAFIDCHQNLDLRLNADETIALLWDSIFDLCGSFGLNFEDIRAPNASVS